MTGFTSTPDDWPTFKEELSRKTSAQLQLWMDRYDRGVINLSTAISVISALYDATSGLVEKDLSNLMADIHRDLISTARSR